MPWRARLACLWTVVILALCWFPRAYMPVDEGARRPFFVANLDKLVHLGIFAAFAFLWMGTARSKGAALGILAAGAALAAVTELGQRSSLVNRDASWQDGLADFVGVVLGLAASLAARMLPARRAAPPGA